MSSVYRTKAEVPPDPPHARLLTLLHRVRPRRREPDDVPPCSAPIWCQLEPDSGASSPAFAAHGRARARSREAIYIAVGASIVAGWFALVAYRQHLHSSFSGEALAMINAVRAAEEVHRAETLGYLGCGQCEGAGCDQVHGSLLARAHPDSACWQQLAVNTDGPVRYTYAVVAGPAGVSPPPIPGLAHQPAWPTSTAPWYLVQAVGDLDGDGVQSMFVGSSFTPEVYVENAPE